MATKEAVGRHTTESPYGMEGADSTAEEGALHDRLVAYVHSLAHGSRRGVWGEHSYARARAGAARGGRVRTLLGPPPPAPAGPLDVDTPPAPAPEPPASTAPLSDDDDTDASDDDWEPRLAARAPDAAHARLAAAAGDALRAMRLERLARPTRAARREQARGAARRLRRALAPLWVAGGGAWLHAALASLLPRATRRLYDEALAELRRAVPRLAARMEGAPGLARAPAPAAPPVGPDSNPWLVWVSSGCAALDARWERRLAALVHTRVLRGAGGAEDAGAAPPEPWGAAAAGAVRAALTDALAEAGSRSVVLGGVGAGAAVALVLARGAGGAGGAGGVRGAVLAAPPLATAEGSREARDDALHACRLPLLLVVGAAGGARGAALAVAEGGPARRLLEVRGADAELRLPRRLRERHALPQEALDAALAEECARWALETAEQEEAPASRRAALPAVVHEIDLCADEEYAHLPPATPPAPPEPAAPPAPPTPSLDSVVRRSPSAPRRVAPPAAEAAPERLAAADIMQLPVVFADDAGSPVTVTSGRAADAGSVKFTRVILAKRGAGRRVLLRRPARAAAAAPRSQ